MPNEEHLAILQRGVQVWNQWREVNPDIIPDFTAAPLSGADLGGADLSGAALDRANLRQANLTKAALTGSHLSGADLSGADLSGADLSYAHLISGNLTKANLRGSDLRQVDLREARLINAELSMANLSGASLFNADLREANLSGASLFKADLGMAKLREACLAVARLHEADVRGADLHKADLREADLREGDLRGANLREADVRGANLRGANLREADLRETDLGNAHLEVANLVGTNFQGATLTGCSVYGISAWNVNLIDARQTDLVITPHGEPAITVDNLEVAQFIYLLLHNEKIRHVIDTVTSKAVLILGRFTPERKAVLDAIRAALRTRDRLPIVFDFAVPRTRTTDETILTLAHMARYVIAGLTDAKSVLQELRAIVPNSPSVLVQPILLASQEEPGMFDFYRGFRSVLEPYRYDSQEEVLAALDAKIIAPVEARYGR
jgi:uncharacterized protein YjbI with pentapeptide repeats